MWPYSKSSPFVDILSANKTARQINFIKKIITTYFYNKKIIIIDAGCGTGRLTIPLCRLSQVKEIIGFDKSVKMLEIAQKKAAECKSMKIKFIKGDLTKPLLLPKADLVICMYTTFNYLTKDSDIISGLKNIKNYLKGTGLALIDLSNLFYYSFISQPNKPIIKIYKRGSLLIKEVITVEYQISKNIWLHKMKLMVKNKSNQKYTVIKELHKLRYISITEMKYFAKEAGLNIEKIFFDYNFKNLNGHRLIFLLKK
ncbi:tRNA (cmo5U34)-methyltransferase [bacterium HR35]|nr:tRNA (cmo5U34)-methyltransferase [bacterium HR35]